MTGGFCHPPVVKCVFSSNRCSCRLSGLLSSLTVVTERYQGCDTFTSLLPSFSAVSLPPCFMMMMFFICSCRNKNQPKAIYSKGTSHHTSLFRGPSTNDPPAVRSQDSPQRLRVRAPKPDDRQAGARVSKFMSVSKFSTMSRTMVISATGGGGRLIQSKGLNEKL
jgi:hypothetical protein